MVKAALLAFLAFAGPLQAQLKYTCTADEGMGGDCCVGHEHPAPASHDCDTDPAAEGSLHAADASPCMELAVADDMDRATRGKSPTEQDCGRDPPPAAGGHPVDSLSADVWRPKARAAAPPALLHGRAADTYLLTLRLRI